ncbi:hypothetical protein AQS8620_01315 [Aquimixticola soesokkakensis]|uniref:Uncharacterized protein n=1 Tax=Aquimixticola soesokkakensis TaxID=1519096 RepID=A0A1Y5SDK4_9RHOB|nr:hypothetical protein [Aquimixticola soesokkakensis]SLN36742.1 hypothetical protein AQS8620_01315 [Aquimixticola soesokkakensis]
MVALVRPVDIETLPSYPFSIEDRIDSHYFMPWERRRWLNSDMRLKGLPECRALYFDLTNIAFDHSPVGTLPVDMKTLAKLVFTDFEHFEALCALPFGPLHNWEPCNCRGEVRLMHPFVVKTLSEAIARKEDNRAKNEAANTAKRLQRLRITIAGYHKDLGANDAAVRWIDEWLNEQGCGYRGGTWIERAIGAWSDHSLRLNLARRGAS